MKKFKYRLERVLLHRQAIKREKLRELMLRNHTLQKDQERLAELERNQLKHRLGDDQVLDAYELMMIGAYADKLREDIATQHETIRSSEKAVEEAKAEYVEASKDAEALEKLKDKKLEQYTEIVRKHEEQFLDELTVLRGTPRTSDER